MHVNDYFNGLCFSKRNNILDDFLLLWDKQPIILQEKQSKLALNPRGVVHENRSILRSSFEIKLSNNLPLSVAKTVNVVPIGFSKEKVLAIETRITESVTGNSYIITINEMASKVKILNKKILQESDVQVSGTIIYSASGNSFVNKNIIMELTQSQKYGPYSREIQGFTEQIKTDHRGSFKIIIPKRKLFCESKKVNVSFVIKFLTELRIEYINKKGCQQKEKIALISTPRIIE